MKFFLIFLYIIWVPSAYAFDLNSYYQNLKSRVENFLFKSDSESELNFPEVPKINANATSVSVYEKKGALFNQGASFKNLSLQEKRKYRMAFIKEIFVQTRGGEVSTQELISSLNILEQGGTREGLYRSIVLGQEYLSLEAYEEEPKERLIKFSLDISRKFLELEYNEQQLKQLNLWIIKRILVEKFLEVMDSFHPDRYDLHAWYAHLSRDLAQDFSSLWKNKLRSNQSLNFHYEWAQKVPFQHIKSEVIVKLHKVMNHIQEN
jgi:hypothetical protein